jgi:hypothetical protein
MLDTYQEINVVEQMAEILARLIRECDPCSFAVGHRDEAVEASPLGIGKQGAFERGSPPEADPEEIAERRRYRRPGRLIPVHIEPQGPKHLRTAVIDRQPEATDRSTACHFQQRLRLA